MSLEAAARRCRVVEHSGRRFLVEAPTLATVILASGLFSKEIAGFAHVAVESPQILTAGPAVWAGVLADLLADTSDGRAGEVLETCCLMVGGSRGDILESVTADASLAVALGVAVLSLCDVPRCFKEAGWEKLGKTPVAELESTEPTGDWFDLSDMQCELGVISLARMYHVAPHEVMTWPFEEVLLSNECTRILDDPNAMEMFRMHSQAKKPARDVAWLTSQGGVS